MKNGTITYERVPVKQLKLDTKNPRIAQWIGLCCDVLLCVLAIWLI